MKPLVSETQIQDFVLLVFNLALIQSSPTISTFCFLFFLKFFPHGIHLNYSFPPFTPLSALPCFILLQIPSSSISILKWYLPVISIKYVISSYNKTMCKPSSDRCGLCSVKLSGGLCASWGIRKCEEGMETVWCGELWEWGCLQAGGLHGPFTARVTFL